MELSLTGGDACCPNCGHLLVWWRDRLSVIFDVEPDKITLDASFTKDLGIDSLEFVEIVMLIEEEFDVTIPDEDAENIKTVADLIRYIEEHRRE